MRLPNTATLAEEWKVAHATAHAALNELTREGWLVRYPKHGTFVSSPAKNLNGHMSRTLTIVFPPRQDIIGSGNGDEVFEALQGLTSGSHTAGWDLRIEPVPSYPSKNEDARILKSVTQAAAAAFIGDSQYAHFIKILASRNYPVVTLISDPGYGHAVIYDRPATVRAGVQCLIDKGFRRIGYIGNSGDVKFGYYKTILSENGLEASPARLGHCPSFHQAGRSVREFLKMRPDCDAVFVANYHIAVALAQEARLAGLRIPRDLAIMAMGIDSGGLSDMSLSYVRVPYLECGSEAMKLMSAASERPPPERKVVTLQPALILREST